MIRFIHKIIPIGYDETDCAKGLPHLKADFLAEASKRFDELVTEQPDKAYFTIIYSGIIGGSYDSIESEVRGFTGEQSGN